jgi:hypothetical protein
LTQLRTVRHHFNLEKISVHHVRFNPQATPTLASVKDESPRFTLAPTSPTVQRDDDSAPPVAMATSLVPPAPAEPSREHVPEVPLQDPHPTAKEESLPDPSLFPEHAPTPVSSRSSSGNLHKVSDDRGPLRDRLTPPRRDDEALSQEDAPLPRGAQTQRYNSTSDVESQTSPPDPSLFPEHAPTPMSSCSSSGDPHKASDERDDDLFISDEAIQLSTNSSKDVSEAPLDAEPRPQSVTRRFVDPEAK